MPPGWVNLKSEFQLPFYTNNLLIYETSGRGDNDKETNIVGNIDPVDAFVQLPESDAYPGNADPAADCYASPHADT